jgi:hypothetical protein
MQWLVEFAKRASFVVQTVYAIWLECGLRIQSQITLAGSSKGVNHHEDRASFYSLFSSCPLPVGYHVLHTTSAFDECQSSKWQCQCTAKREFADECQCFARPGHNATARSRHR